jgi:hypothetical protein
MRVAPPIALTSEQQEELEQCARIVLLAAAGKQDKDVAGNWGSPRRRQLAGGSDFSR